MSTRRARSLILGAVLTAATMLAAGCSSDSSAAETPSDSGPAELRIGYQAIPNGDLVVKSEGWLEEALPGTRITWTKFESGGDVNTAFIAGALDIGLAGSSPVVRGLSEPNNISYAVPWIHDVIGEAESLVAPSASGVTRVEGLRGKKIATPFASTAHYSLLAGLSQAGVAESDVTIVDLEPTDILAAWTRGDIDAAYVWSPTLDELKASGGTVLATSKALAEAGYPTYDLAVVSNDFRQKYPTAVQAWLQQQDRAVQLINSDPAAAAAAIAPELAISADQVQEQLKGLEFLGAAQQASSTYFGSADEPGSFADSLLKAAEFQKAQGKIDAVPTLATLQQGIDLANFDAAFVK